MTNVAYAYAKARKNFALNNLKWDSSITTMYMALYTSLLAPDQDDDEVYSNTNELATANGYTQGGAQMTLNDPAIAGTVPDAYTKLYGSDVTWPTSTFTGVRTVVIYKNSGTKYLVGYMTYDADKAAQGGNFTVSCPAAGWYNF